jgi:hypothetical protein
MSKIQNTKKVNNVVHLLVKLFGKKRIPLGPNLVNGWSVHCVKNWFINKNINSKTKNKKNIVQFLAKLLMRLKMDYFPNDLLWRRGLK